jgi:tetratricopeptide (TPR) repeat protein
MDLASAELLTHLIGESSDQPWVFGVTRRPSTVGFTAPAAMASVIKIGLSSLAPKDALRMAQVHAEQHPLPLHVLEAVANRSGGNPQFMRDLLRAAIESGSAGGLPDSAEAAAMARIDALAPEDRALVRRAAVLGLTFHPRMLSWISEDVEGSVPGPAAWERVQELFDAEPDGYLRFRRSLLRDAAYEGLPYKLRRRLHGAVAIRLEEEMDHPDDAAGILSMHYLEAGDYAKAWRYAGSAAKRAQGAYAYVEAAGLYTRALDAGRRLGALEDSELAAVNEAQADCWYRAGEYQKAAHIYSAAYRLVGSDRLAQSKLLLMRSWSDDKLGNYQRALRWAAMARRAVSALDDPRAATQVARTTSWYASALYNKGRAKEALRWAERALNEAQAAGDAEALGEVYNVMGLAYGTLGKEGAQTFFQRSLEAYERSGNLIRQAGLLGNLGVAFQAEGRWAEALSFYERGRTESLKLGNTINAALVDINIAEILIDRGEVDDAERLLLQTLPLWRAAHYRFFLAACVSLQGRASLRAGRFEQALRYLGEAKTNFASIKADEEIPAIDARIAECTLLMGDSDAALEIADSMLRRVGTSAGVARMVPLLRRVRAHVLLARGHTPTARQELETSLAAGRERRDLYEILRTLLSIAAFHRLQGLEPPDDIVTESDSLLSELSIAVVPTVPTTPACTV